MTVIRDWDRTRLADVLQRQVQEAWRVIKPNLAGLTDEEYLWEPTVGCWSVRRRAEAATELVWGKGDWVVENSWDPPSPPPVTTIAWRLMHGYDCLNDYAGRGGLHVGPQDWNEIEVPAHADGAVALMTDLFRRIDTDLGAIDDEALQHPAGDDPRPAWWAIGFGLLEATHHCAEIGVLRTLFRVSA
jgi:DinB superfamily